MALSFTPRQDVGVPQPLATRPKMRNERYLLVHYVNDKLAHPTTPDGEIEQARAVVRWGQTRPNDRTDYEYNWHLGWLGTVFEHGGEFQSAHCRGANDIAIGVVFHTGADGPSQAQIEAFRNLRLFLVQRGDLVVDHEVRPHYHMRSTSCPGPGLAGPQGATWASPTGEGRIGSVIPALLGLPTPSPLPIVTEDDPMLIIQPVNPDGSVDSATFVVCGPYASWCKDGYEVAAHISGGAHLGSDGTPWKLPRTELRRLILIGPGPEYGRPAISGETMSGDFLRWVS